MRTTTLLALLICSLQTYAQDYAYLPNNEHPFGQLNPKAPREVGDYAEMIGICDCLSVARIDQNTWADTIKMTWTFKYIMNGMAVQDETHKVDGLHSGSIRQFNADSSQWFVHYYSTAATPQLGSWHGNRTGNEIILYRDQPSPQGIPGFYKITFSNISENGFDWLGEWVSQDESFHYPTWKIYCKKKKV